MFAHGADARDILLEQSQPTLLLMARKPSGAKDYRLIFDDEELDPAVPEDATAEQTHFVRPHGEVGPDAPVHRLALADLALAAAESSHAPLRSPKQTGRTERNERCSCPSRGVGRRAVSCDGPCYRSPVSHCGACAKRGALRSVPGGMRISSAVISRCQGARPTLPAIFKSAHPHGFLRPDQRHPVSTAFVEDTRHREAATPGCIALFTTYSPI